MLRNYITIALRLLIKNKVFSLINILGLSIGIACCILITLYIQDEFSYEKGFPEYEKIFRINTTFIKDGVSENGAYTSPPIAPDLTEALPEIETFTRIMSPRNTEVNIVLYGDKSFFEKNAFLVDSTFLDVFGYMLVEGDPATALDAPSTTLISQRLAKKIFNDASAIDEQLIINSGTFADTFRITGVVATPEYPSHVDADIYMCMNSRGWGRWALGQTTWANNNVVGSYLKLKDPSSYKQLEAKFPSFMEKNAGEELRQSGRQKILTLQKLADTRLYSDLRKSDSTAEGSSITYIYSIATIGIFILVLACINFMNLTTAKSAQRAGEIGIRKSMGAFRANLIRQFLGESVVMVLFALVLAFLIVWAALPSFNNVMQKQLTLGASNLLFILASAFLISIITALLAGSYPAFYLSAMRPTQVLKSKSLVGGSQWLRKGLVVIQFVITITLISSIVIIQQQLNYIQSKSLGFNADQVIMIPMRTAEAAQQYTTLKTSFEQLQGVNMISAASSIPSTPLARDWGVYKQGWTNEQSVFHDIVNVDADYFKTMDIGLMAGRDFVIGQDNVPGDTVNTMKIILNEASLKALDMSLEQAVGSTIYFQPGNERYQFTVVGVVKNFHQFSLHREIKPMIFILSGNRNSFPYLAAAIRMEDYNRLVASMKKIWSERINNAPFESIFVKENLKALYAAESRTSTMLTISTVIALIISCLGLYGLSVYVAERKTKEIGVRKVVGASIGSIVSLLSKEYITLIIISFIISIPLGYYFMNKWLEGFAYKISPGVSVFLVSGIVSFLVAWLTVSFEAFKAARANPIKALKEQ